MATQPKKTYQMAPAGAAVATVSNQKLTTLRDLIEKNIPQLKMALPKHMDAERFSRVFFTTVRRTPKLLECDLHSLVGKLIQAGQLGLEVDSIRGSAHLVPFYNNRAGRMDCELIPGYKGLIDLAERSGRVAQIYADIVYSKEEWSMTSGLERDLKHKPLPPSQRGDDWVGAYAVAVLKDNPIRQWVWLWKEEVEKIKATSKTTREDSPWNQWPEAMIKKTAIRNLAKFLPLSPEFVKAAALDEAVDMGLDTKEIFFEDEPGQAVTAESSQLQDKTGVKIDVLKAEMAGQIHTGDAVTNLLPGVEGA